MKRSILVLLTLTFTSFSCEKEYIEPIGGELPSESTTEVDVATEPNESDSQLQINPLIQAMILVESTGNDSAYCKREEAVGCLQIRPIMLRECNRILKLQNSSISYNLTDRWSREKSIEIFHIINQYHNKNATYEEIARFWNGGPKWAEKSGTKRYWRKVRRKLKKLSKKNEKHSSDRVT